MSGVTASDSGKRTWGAMAGNGLQERLVDVAEEVGRLKSELEGKLIALGLGAGEVPMSMQDATAASEEEVPR